MQVNALQGIAMTNEKKDCQITFRAPCRLKEALAKLAEDEHRKPSDMAVILLDEALEKRAKRRS